MFVLVEPIGKRTILVYNDGFGSNKGQAIAWTGEKRIRCLHVYSSPNHNE